MESKVILIVGQRGSGKTTDVKKLIKNVHPDALLLHDVSHQYSDVYNKPLLDFHEFTALANKVSKAVIVFEEATIFVSHHRNEDIVNFLVRSRHRENTIIFVFHSLRTVPRFIYDLANMIILHKTKDNISFVESRFEDQGLTDTFNMVQKHDSKYFSMMYKTD